MAPTFYCLSEEISASGTPHIHAFVIFPTPRRFSTLKRRFPIAHIENAYGSPAENVSYIKKDGIWADSDKASTSVPGTYREFGKLPLSKDDKYDEIINMLREGSNIADVIDCFPNQIYKVRQLEALQESLNLQKYGVNDRDVHVTLLYTDRFSDAYAYVRRQVHGKICRITVYRERMSFDSYKGEDTILFDNFTGQIPVGEMIPYIDKHPVSLPARFSDKEACYTNIFIATPNPAPYEQPSSNARLVYYIDDEVDLRGKD